jgi:hypothetical protein
MNRKVAAVKRFADVTKVKFAGPISTAGSSNPANLSHRLAFAAITGDIGDGPRRPNAARALCEES